LFIQTIVERILDRLTILSVEVNASRSEKMQVEETDEGDFDETLYCGDCGDLIAKHNKKGHGICRECRKQVQKGRWAVGPCYPKRKRHRR